MKLQINTDSKVIKIESTVKIKDILDTLKKMLPDYEDYYLESNTNIINWERPTHTKKHIPNQPYWYMGLPGSWTEHKTNSVTLENKGVYNIEV